MVARRPLRTTRVQEQSIGQELSLDHHIPNILIDRVVGLKNVLHKDILNEFCENYRHRKFRRIEDEYLLINEVIGKLLDASFTQQLREVVKRSMHLSLVAPYFEESIREQFIHSFQVFLLGTVIVDNFFKNFQRWYSKYLCRSPKTCLESSWLLTTIFHDHAKNIDALKKILEIEMGSYSDIISDEPVYISKISSAFAHLASKKPLEQWPSKTTNDSFARILSDYSSRWNHGVKGSTVMLRHINNAIRRISPRDIAAALGIAVHDKELHDCLLRGNFFPLDIQLFPIACLLIYCDTIEEWGRLRLGIPTEITEVPTEITRLVTFRIDKNNVYCEVCFDSDREALNKLTEIRGIRRCITASPLTLDFGVRVHVSR